MENVDKVSRESFSTAVVKTKLSTCSYEEKKGRIRCKDAPRITVLEAAEKRIGEGNRNTKSVALVLEPVAEKGIGLLTYEYYEAERDNDVWLYLSALNKVKRMISSSEGGEDGGAFFGTEFFVDDVSLMKIEDFTFSIAGEEVYKDRPVWLVEAIPTEARLKKTHYGKILMWIDKERYITLKQNFYNHFGKLFKQRFNDNVVNVSGVWLPKNQIMKNLIERRITANQNVSVTYHVPVPDELLEKRTLEDFAFRERMMKELRNYHK
jgi:hypothetical protein